MNPVPIAALMLCAVVQATGALAAEPVPVARGERIRVTYLMETRPAIVTGLCEGSTAESLWVAGGATGGRALEWRAIRGLERHAGRYGHAGTGSLIGLGVGLGAGIITGAVMARESQFFDGTTSAVLVGSGITAAGAVLGTLVGALVRSDRWREVPLAPGRAPSQP